MDSSDWVTLIVSLATIIFSVLGAHNLASNHDKRKEMASLFGVICADTQSFYVAFRDCLNSAENMTKFLTHVSPQNIRDEKSGHNESTALLKQRMVDSFIVWETKHNSLEAGLFRLLIVVGEKQTTEIAKKIQQAIHLASEVLTQLHGNMEGVVNNKAQHLEEMWSIQKQINNKMIDCYRNRTSLCDD